MNEDNRKGDLCAAGETEAYETSGRAFDFEELLHPSRAFAQPSDVVADGDLTLNEKRAILASWASDACAAEANPELRTTAGGAASWDDIMDALKALDLQAARSEPTRSDPQFFWRARRGLRLGPRGDAN